METKFSSIASFLSFSLRNSNSLPELIGKTLNSYYKSYTNHFSSYIKKHYNRQSYEIIQQINLAISSGNVPRILEVGCGCGTESLFFALLGADVLGIDIKDDRLAVANARLEFINTHFNTKLKCQFRKAGVFDSDLLDLKGSFDIIWAEQAYHHIEPRNLFSPTVYDLLKPGGMLILSESNGWNPLIQLVLFLKRGFNTIVSYTDSNGNSTIYGNERITVPYALSNDLGHSRFKLISKKYFRVFPNVSFLHKFDAIERIIPQSLSFLFTHFNAVYIKSI